jgi:hypothetical protein
MWKLVVIMSNNNAYYVIHINIYYFMHRVSCYI